jgi:hypothetical protein
VLTPIEPVEPRMAMFFVGEGTGDVVFVVGNLYQNEDCKS